MAKHNLQEMSQGEAAYARRLVLERTVAERAVRHADPALAFVLAQHVLRFFVAIPGALLFAQVLGGEEAT